MRKYYLDWLRVYAIIAVVMIHVSAGVVLINLHKHNPSFFLAGNLYETIARYAVPIFFMISGALMLGKRGEISLRGFLLKRTSKILVPLICWSIFYYLYKVSKGTFDFSVPQFFRYLLTDQINYHLWFMYAILGLYLITPLLVILIKNAKRVEIEYFLLLWGIGTVISAFVRYYFGFTYKLELNHVAGNIGFFVLGYYLDHYDFTKKFKRTVNITGLIGVVVTFFLTYWYTQNNNGQLVTYWYSNFAPNVVFVSMAIFLGMKSLNIKKALPPVLNLLSIYSFGIYLVHALVIYFLKDYSLYLDSNRIHPMITVPINIFIILSISTLMVYIIKKLPFLNKLIP
ncbi:acyltransferase family protein [Neobacillus sp. OS1-33]|uniref:acyltransferase n=1 Tax=Neobacillus sp. OS1-33 TaxID=3070683 RepID=UPI0027DF483D|nr:acyltransferase family protein [Neobacillus sp. OS1-33]WML24850.1 acyltransferase family protein [Neobacillus sp. OS1-33]